MDRLPVVGGAGETPDGRTILRTEIENGISADPLDDPTGKEPFPPPGSAFRLYLRNQELDGGTSAIEYQDVHASLYS
jgi:hypothetical protein